MPSITCCEGAREQNVIYGSSTSVNAAVQTVNLGTRILVMAEPRLN